MANQDFICLEGSMSTGLFFPCRYCPLHGRQSLPPVAATVLPRHLVDFISCQPSSKSWCTLVGPLMNYMTPKIMLPPILVKYFLNVIEETDRNDEFRHLETILEQHRSLHPPCRPQMHEYYCSVFLEPLTSPTMSDQPVAEGFLHLIRKLAVSFSQYKEPRPQPKQRPLVPTNDKDVLAMLKNILRTPTKPMNEKPAHLKLDIQIFVLKYCINILLHDFITRRKTEDQDESFEKRPLISKIVYGRLGKLGTVNVHIEEIFQLYFSSPKLYSKEVARYVVLLAEIVRFHDSTAQPEFPHNGHNVDEFCSKLGDMLLENGRVTEKSLRLIRLLPSNWLTYLVGFHLLIGQYANSSKHFPFALKRARSAKKPLL